MKANNPLISRGVLLLLCFLPFTSHSQRLHLSNTKDIPIPVSCIDKHIISCKFNKDVFYISESDIHSDLHFVDLHRIQISDGFQEVYKLKKTERMNIAELPLSIAVSANHLMLIDDTEGNIFQFKRLKNQFIFEKQVQFPGRLRFRTVVTFSEERFLFEELYLSSEPHLPISSIGMYNATNGKIEKIIHPDINCAAYSYFDVHPFSNNEKYIALSDLCSYQIHIYNKDLIKIRTIRLTDTSYHEIPHHRFPFETDPMKVHPKSTISKIKNVKDNFNKIERIEFVDEQILAVISNSKTNPKTMCRIDFWNCINGDLITSIKEQSIDFKREQHVSSDTLPFMINKLKGLFISNNYMGGFNNDPYLPFLNTSFEEFQTRKNIYYETTDPVYHFQLFNINLSTSE